MKITVPCPACGQDLQKTACDDCGKEIADDDDVVVLAVGLASREMAPQYLKGYCRGCAPKHVPPAALGIEPGNDLPAVEGEAP